MTSRAVLVAGFAQGNSEYGERLGLPVTITELADNLKPRLVIFPFELRLGCLLLIPAFARIAWLARTWQRRRLCEPPAMREVDLGGNVRASLRDPLVVALLTFIVPYYLPIWWYLLNRELSRYGRRREVPGLGRAPMASLLAMLPTIRILAFPALVSVVRTHLRLQRAEASVGQAPERPQDSARMVAALLVGGSLIVLAPIASPAALIAPRLLLYVGSGVGVAADAAYIAPLAVLIAVCVVALCVSPVVVAYLQGRANRIWKRAGRPVIEGPQEETSRR